MSFSVCASLHLHHRPSPPSPPSPPPPPPPPPCGRRAPRLPPPSFRRSTAVATFLLGGTRHASPVSSFPLYHLALPATATPPPLPPPPPPLPPPPRPLVRCSNLAVALLVSPRYLGASM